MQVFGLATIGRNVELRYRPDGGAVANVSLAFSYGRKGDDGKKPTQWVDASLWGKRAEALAPYLLKGTKVAVTLDDVHIESFQRSDETPGTKLVGLVSQLSLAGSPSQAGQPPAPRPAPRPPAPAAASEDMDDDSIPF
jgi:single-strand DNA-binding protein